MLDTIDLYYMHSILCANMYLLAMDNNMFKDICSLSV